MLAQTPFTGWRSWYAYYTQMNQDMITGVIDALAEKNRTVKGWEGKVSLCDLGYCSAGIDEGARAIVLRQRVSPSLPSRGSHPVCLCARRMGGLRPRRGPHSALLERHPRHQPDTLPRHEGHGRLRPQKGAQDGLVLQRLRLYREAQASQWLGHQLRGRHPAARGVWLRWRQVRWLRADVQHDPVRRADEPDWQGL